MSGRSVEYSDIFVRSLENELRSKFGPSYLTLSRQPNNSGSEFFIQLNHSLFANLDNGDQQGVVEITNVARADTFYLGFEAVFSLADVVNKNRRYSLKTVSLTVFHRVVRELVPMFRAEWDNEHAADASAIHAQPHWHFVQSPERIERIVIDSLAPKAEVSDFNSAPRQATLFRGIADCGSFHFSMSSLWETTDVPPLKRQFDLEDFRKWFSGLTKYIAGQLKFLAEKMPQNESHSFSGAI